MKYYYVQSEGNVFLVREGDRMRLPKPEEVPFKTRKVITMKLDGREVVWCDSEVHEGEGWVHRDDLLTSHNNADELAKTAAIKSYPRVTAAVFLTKGRDILLVKPNRGIAKDRWIAPGGFVEYGESPEETARRETEEEVGLKVGKMDLLSVETTRYESNNFHFVTVFFIGKAEGMPKRRNDEIGEMKFVPISEALAMSTEPNNRAALEKLAKRLIQ